MISNAVFIQMSNRFIITKLVLREKKILFLKDINRM